MVDGVVNSNSVTVKAILIIVDNTTPMVKVTTVSINETTVSLTVGESDNLIATVNPRDANNKDVTWTSSDNNIATVDSRGKVTAVSSGTATITVTTVDGGKTARAKVTVSSFNTSMTSITKNETLTNVIIDGDLYVDENVVLTINGNLTVNGSLYVHGCIKNYGYIQVINTMHLRQLAWDNGIANGKVCMLSNQNINMGTDIGTMIFDIVPIVK